MKVNLTKKDIDVLLDAGISFDEPPDELALLLCPDAEEIHNQWQKTKAKLCKALGEMEKGK
jgi:hypothetical protein